MVVFILYYIKFKYSIGYIGARSAREGGRGKGRAQWANGGAIPG